MAHAISRIFATKADADAAIEDLGRSGFPPEAIFVVAPPAAAAAASASDSRAVADQIADRIAKGFILRRDAEVYARHVAQGAVFVTVYAPFGAGRKATNCLDRRNPVDPGIPAAPVRRPAAYDEATPLSSTLRLPVLSSHPTPFGAVSGLPSLLSAKRADKSVFEGPAPLSHLLDLPVMTAGGETTSAAMGLPLLTAKGKPTALGLPLVTAKGSPMFWGLPLLTAKGKPTSLGLPLVTARGRPTSLGLPLLW
ncbi:hypothetical protein [Roseiarcus fermentans]|uniref:hypothetical protein n=1 Tax=Roseiarcus fermentans TaxID=1473586 RepID=UPI000DEB6968|nr:hypothetical protein [Roseiarcus fermentans]